MMGVTERDRAALRSAKVRERQGRLWAEAGRLLVHCEQPWLRRGTDLALVNVEGGDAEIEAGVLVPKGGTSSGVPDSDLQVGGATRDPAVVLAARWLVAFSEHAVPLKVGGVYDLTRPLPPGPEVWRGGSAPAV